MGELYSSNLSRVKDLSRFSILSTREVDRKAHFLQYEFLNFVSKRPFSKKKKKKKHTDVNFDGANAVHTFSLHNLHNERAQAV